MSDHHDDFGSFDEHHEPLPFDDTPGHDDTPAFDHDDHDIWADDHDPALGHNFSEMSENGGDHGVGEPDHDDTPDHSAPADHHGTDDYPTGVGHGTGEDAGPIDVFPPTLDVGDLPEPVDGFPWIDTGSLGVVDPAAVAGHVEPVRPQELAEYAGEQIPPGADPWAALAESDDPATSALARWWNQD